MDKDGIPMHNGAEEYAKIGLTTLPKEVTIIDNLLISGLKGPINKYDASPTPSQPKNICKRLLLVTKTSIKNVNKLK